MPPGSRSKPEYHKPPEEEIHKLAKEPNHQPETPLSRTIISTDDKGDPNLCGNLLKSYLFRLFLKVSVQEMFSSSRRRV
jgi:hypothetical protein